MRKFLAVLAIAMAVLCFGTSFGIAGPHGCYRSQGCH